jgi:hypothetical protein
MLKNISVKYKSCTFNYKLPEYVTMICDKGYINKKKACDIYKSYFSYSAEEDFLKKTDYYNYFIFNFYDGGEFNEEKYLLQIVGISDDKCIISRIKKGSEYY